MVHGPQRDLDAHNRNGNDDDNTNTDTKEHAQLFADPIFVPQEPKEGEMPSREWLQNNFQTKSAIIRYLTENGWKTKHIAKHTGFRYQHVKNVQDKDLKRGPMEVYHDQRWTCSHAKSGHPFIEVLLRLNLRDTSNDKVVYRVCVQCAYDNIPGITREVVARMIPGAKIGTKP